MMNSQMQSNSVYSNANNANHPEDVYRVHRTTSLDNLGGGYLLKRNSNPLDSLGGGYLLAKRNRESPRATVLDSLGGGYLL